MQAVWDWFATAGGSVRGELLASAAVVGGAVVLLFTFKRSLHRWSAKVERDYTVSHDYESRERGQRLVTLTSVAEFIARLAVWGVVVLTIMGIWGIPMSPFVAVAATIGIAVGFGAQDLVKDVIAGFFILVEDQFGIGDVVSIAGVSGTVEAIKLRTTVLRDLNGNEHHVPNGHITVASNMTPDVARVVADIAVSYDTDVDQAIAVIGDEMQRLANDPEWSDAFLQPTEMLGVNKLDDSAVVIRAVATVVTEKRWAVKREFLRRIKNRLDAEGIEIPYNYVTVVIRGEDD